MVGFGNGLLRDDETSMAARAAWLHYAGGLTQSEVAKRLGLTSLKAHRLITKANQEGLVKVYIDGEVSECVALEDELSGRYGLDYCEVVPDFDPEDLPQMFGAPELSVTRWGTLRVDHKTMQTSLPGVFAAGDIVRGASLVVWGVRDGRDVSERMHAWLKDRAKVAKPAEMVAA